MDETSAIRVCLVAPRYMLGGQATEAQNLLRGFATDPAVEIMLQPIDPRIPAPLARVRGLRTLVRWPLFIAGLLGRLRNTDVLHVFTAAFWPFLLTTTPAVLLGRLLGRSVILNYRDGRAEAHLRHAWVRWVIRRAHVRVFPSGFLLDVFSRVGLSGVVVANVVDEEIFRFRLRQQLRPRLVSCRLLETLYAVENTMYAFGRVQERFPDAQLVIAGDGHLRADLERLAVAAGLRNVEFVGRLDQHGLAAIFDAADVFVNSSRIDNMPHAIVEAFSAGLPVVTTAAGGIPWVVKHGRNGMLVDIDDPEAMARSVIELLEEPERARAIIDNARADCEAMYTWRAAGRQWKDLYAQLVGTRHHLAGSETTALRSAKETA